MGLQEGMKQVAGAGVVVVVGSSCSPLSLKSNIEHACKLQLNLHHSICILQEIIDVHVRTVHGHTVHVHTVNVYVHLKLLSLIVSSEESNETTEEQNEAKILNLT